MRIRSDARFHQYGFSLIEIVMAMVVVSVSAVALLGGFNNVARSVAASESLAVGAALGGECGEYILGVRRRGVFSFAAIDNQVCNILPLPGGYTRSVTVSPTDNTATPACPVGAVCSNVLLSISHGTTTWYLTTLLLVDS